MTQSTPVYQRNCELKAGMVMPEGMRRVALQVEYNGAVFRGFQKQQSTPQTVQAALEKALSSVANEPVTLICAGRTDAGVHATSQVVHFDTLATRPAKAWVEGVNTQLPDAVRVVRCQEVDPAFHARFSAQYRRYCYLIHEAPVRSALFPGQMTWVRHSLDAEAMHRAAQVLLGEQDFSSFRSSQCQAASPVRELQQISVERYGDLVVIEVQANAFLHHMVRNITGTLLRVGRLLASEDWVAEVLAARDRTQAAETAPAAGLYFVDVGYPAAFGIPPGRGAPQLLAR